MEKLTKSYRLDNKEILVLDGIDATFPETGIVVISGLSGAGKSTLIRIIAGLQSPSSGSVYIDGIDITRLGAYELAWFRRKKIGFKPQDPVLIPHLTLVENVALPLQFNYVNKGKALSEAERILREVGLGNRLGHKPDEISGGEYERTSFAQTIIGSPPIVILDEPTAHLDSESSKRIAEIIKRKQKETGSMYIVTTLEPTLIEEAECRVCLISGRLETID